MLIQISFKTFFITHFLAQNFFNLLYLIQFIKMVFKKVNSIKTKLFNYKTILIQL